MFPDFLGIGAQKAGTTWLHENLSRHPQVWLPPIKEIHYFDHAAPSLRRRLFGKPMQLRSARRYLRQSLLTALAPGGWERLTWAARYCLGRRDDRWYAELFPRRPGVRCGEICPGYCRLDAEAVARVHRLMPHAKIIYLLRNPLERAWSTVAMHFNKSSFDGIERAPAEAVRAHLTSPKTLAHDDYLANIAAWRASYPESQVLIGFYDELAQDPGGLLRRVLRFLEIDDSPAAVLERAAEKHNVGRGGPVPDRLKPFLAELHAERIRALDAAFANAYTRQWRDMVECWRAEQANRGSCT